jgi:hypothetical protein
MEPKFTFGRRVPFTLASVRILLLLKLLSCPERVLVKIILLLLFHCLHTLYSIDGVLSHGAFKALKRFVLIASQNNTLVVPTANERGTQSFSRVRETSMIRLLVKDYTQRMTSFIVTSSRYFVKCAETLPHLHLLPP